MTAPCAHGTRERYRRHRCRCLFCKAANARYVQQRRMNGPDPAEHVLATPAQTYLQQLRALGVGYRRAAELSGISATLLLAIRTGKRAIIRADIQARILAIRPSLAHGQRVMAWRERRLLDALHGEGYPRAATARQLGLRSRNLHLHARRQMTVRNALKVRALFQRVTEDTSA